MNILFIQTKIDSCVEKDLRDNFDIISCHCNIWEYENDMVNLDLYDCIAYGYHVYATDVHKTFPKEMPVFIWTASPRLFTDANHPVIDKLDYMWYDDLARLAYQIDKIVNVKSITNKF